MANVDYIELAAERLEEGGFLEQPIWDAVGDQKISSDFQIYDRRVSYMTTPEVRDAGHLVFSAVPYSASVTDFSTRLRYAAMQHALGPDYGIVAVEPHEPNTMPFTRTEGKNIKDGSFKLFADRMLQIMEKVTAGGDQQVSLFGYSMGADVATATAHENLFGVTGTREISHLGVYEPARTKNRGPTNPVRALRTAIAFARSGPALWDNILASESPALLQARDITDVSKSGKKKHQADVGRTVFDYVTADLATSYALGAGFGTDETIGELLDLARDDAAPLATVARMGGSTVTSPKLIDDLQWVPGRWDLRVYSGQDHSAADRLQNSAAFVLETLRVA